MYSHVFFEDDMFRCCQQEFYGAPVATASRFFSIQALGPFLTLQVRSQRSNQNRISKIWPYDYLLSCWINEFFFLFILPVYDVDAPSDMTIPKAERAFAKKLVKPKKQPTHLTPIILPIISGFHLLPSVFVIYTLSKVRENIKPCELYPSWISVIYGCMVLKPTNRGGNQSDLLTKRERE